MSYARSLTLARAIDLSRPDFMALISTVFRLPCTSHAVQVNRAYQSAATVSREQN